MLAQDQSSSAKRGGLADVSSGLIFFRAVGGAKCGEWISGRQEWEKGGPFGGGWGYAGRRGRQGVEVAVGGCESRLGGRRDQSVPGRRRREGHAEPGALALAAGQTVVPST